MSGSHESVEGAPYAHHAWVDESTTFGDVSAYIWLR
jgi:hypothetical protein